MYKKGLLLLLVIFVSFFLFGCEIVYPNNTTTQGEVAITTIASDLDLWKNSDEAFDYNGDRKIDQEDYDIYLLQNDYEFWKTSDEALDYDNNHIIDELDFEKYKLHTNYNYWKLSEEAIDLNGDAFIDETDHEIYNNYDFWINSDEAEDLNDDSTIDVSDYEVYIEYVEFVGTYYLTNYTYDGAESHSFGENVLFSDMGDYLSQITVSVNGRGEFTVTIPDNIKTIFGDSHLIMIEAANNMTISRLSPFIVAIDTNVIMDGIEYNLTIYLDETEAGYSASYIMGFYYDEPEITFDIVKAE
ncbi:hypothetical protein ACAG96_06440 [Candidatus Izemoplasma sp. B36]|uniref:hypothetical protein n=1 Tax=Candidatus Izemoplasma sp. B36 TaxID=3242468 RepID=UPI003556CE94